VVATTTVLLATASGCGFGGLYDVTLPGGADVGDHPFHVTADFADVLDLVPQSAVKVDDVAVGRVESISLADDGRTAQVTVLVNGAVRLPANAVARLRQTSVLGEKFVELAAPDDLAPDGRLAEGARIPIERTNRNPQIEEVFGALSMLLNGGGLGQLQQITKELNLALGGNEEQIRGFLSGVDTFVSALDAHRADITRAIDGLDQLAKGLADRKDQVTNLLDNLGPGIAVLDQQRAALTTMLTSLDTLSTVAVDTVSRSRDNLVADLRALEPTLRKLTEAGQNLPQAMELLFTFPFPDSALNAVKGDYLNGYLTLDAKTHGPSSAAAGGGG
jgi:phospholipid/cholesterol/gamma-HCH transport system substrate-binding protein